MSTNNFHWTLIVIDLAKSKVVIYDLMKKPQHDYKVMIDIIQR